MNPCPSVSLWPDINAPSQQFSDGVASYVAAPYNNGAITYVEYGYALQRGFPVASVLNRAGYYVQPNPQDVAIALQGARINADGTQNLQGVYTFGDSRAYPVSSYSYMIVPTTTATPFTAEKGKTLSKFILYFVCVGQQKAAQLGYSPLPQAISCNSDSTRSTASRAMSRPRRSTSATIPRSPAASSPGRRRLLRRAPRRARRAGVVEPRTNANSGATASQSNTGTTATTVAARAPARTPNTAPAADAISGGS